MLVLGRRLGESIIISTGPMQAGQVVKVTTLSVTGGQMRIGIEAPAGTAVDREEVYNSKQKEIKKDDI